MIVDIKSTSQTSKRIICDFTGYYMAESNVEKRASLDEDSHIRLLSLKLSLIRTLVLSIVKV